MEIPTPHSGLVIGYEYLWHDQSKEGMENGLKSRPCVVVLVKTDGITAVVPITHTRPEDISSCIEVPLKTAARLGLDSEQSYIICSEINEFKWPGPDLRNALKSDTAAYGVLPPRLYEQVVKKITFLAQGRKLRAVGRTE